MVLLLLLSYILIIIYILGIEQETCLRVELLLVNQLVSFHS